MELKAEKLSKMFKTGTGIIGLKEKLPKIRNEADSGSRCGIDKHYDGFRGDADHNFVIRNFKYESCTGTYGDSSVYSDIARLDGKLLAEYLFKYLNKHKDNILAEIGEMIISDASKEKEGAILELKELIREVEKCRIEEKK